MHPNKLGLDLLVLFFLFSFMIVLILFFPGRFKEHQRFLVSANKAARFPPVEAVMRSWMWRIVVP